MLFAATLSAQTSDAGASLAGLNPGDQVRIAVWRNPEFSGDFIIAPNGTISHPLYREIQVVGVPLPTVEDRLRVFLTKYIANPQFVIQPLMKIIVGGEVRSPNVYSVPPETTIAQAIALAGGPTERGNAQKLRVIRDGQEIVVDLTKADSDVARLQIRSGDQILMPRRSARFRDYVVPILSGAAALAAIVNIFVTSAANNSN
jgi:polysaccharide export outer membrane protein